MNPKYTLDMYILTAVLSILWTVMFAAPLVQVNLYIIYTYYAAWYMYVCIPSATIIIMTLLSKS